MIEVASLIVLNLLIAVAIGFAIGYLVGKNKSATVGSFDSKKEKKIDTDLNEKKKTKSGVNPVFKKNSNLDNKPLVMSTPKPSGKDNLKKIKGIDTYIEKDLNSLGIYHFEQIANWSSKNCDWVETFLLEPGCAKNNQWIEQAKILKTGKETVYSQKVENGEV